VPPRLQRTLELPRAFDIWQRVGGADASKREFIEHHVRPQRGDRILDIGSGTGALRGLAQPETAYLGVEIERRYVDVARARFGDTTEFICGDIATVQLPADRTFDLAIAYGVFHHLDWPVARRAIDVAAGALDAGGALFIAEPCWAPDQGWFEKLLMRLDRGRFIRTAEEYADIVRTRFTDVRTNALHNAYRVPYTMSVIEGHARNARPG
jgi:SAM-dependent methyltransferase